LNNLLADGCLDDTERAILLNTLSSYNYLLGRFGQDPSIEVMSAVRGKGKCAVDLMSPTAVQVAQMSKSLQELKEMFKADRRHGGKL
jgi:hypothetical protein